jgi:hypothetical protein
MAQQWEIGGIDPTPITGTSPSDDITKIINSFNTVRSLFSGASEPNTDNREAYSWWVDTTNDLLKQRNGSNTGWITRASAQDELVIIKLANYTVVESDYGRLILVDASASDVTITLPPLATGANGYWVSIKKIDETANKVIVAANGAELIDGNNTYEMDAQGDSVSVRFGDTEVNVESSHNAGGQSAASAKNLLINGNFNVWQRGAAFNITGASSIYTADRWRVVLPAAGANAAVSRQQFTAGQTEVPGNPQYFYKANITSTAAGDLILEQRIEDVRTIAGEKATSSIFLKSSGLINVTVDLLQNFGTGGSPTVTTSATVIATSSSWEKFTITHDIPGIAGKTIGQNSYIALRFRFPSTALSFVDFARAQLEMGQEASDFEDRKLGSEIAMCERFYQKSYNIGTPPGAAAAFSGNVTMTINKDAPARLSSNLASKMRSTPALIIYSPQTGSGGFVYRRPIGATASDLAATVADVGDSRFSVEVASGTNASGIIFSFHWSADSEL